MSHAKTDLSGLVSKDFHNSVVANMSKKHLKDLRLLAGMCGNPDSVDGCRLISKKIQEIIHDRNMETLDRVKVIMDETKEIIKSIEDLEGK